MVKDKLVLRRIAKRWCQAILLMNDITGETTCELLSEEEDEIPATNLDEIIKEEFDFETN